MHREAACPLTVPIEKAAVRYFGLNHRKVSDAERSAGVLSQIAGGRSNLGANLRPQFPEGYMGVYREFDLLRCAYVKETGDGSLLDCRSLRIPGIVC